MSNKHKIDNGGLIIGMAKLILRSKIGDIPIAYQCSDCEQIFAVPSDGTADENRQALEREYNQHLANKHTK
jgi:hypothetical protein